MRIKYSNLSNQYKKEKKKLLKKLDNLLIDGNYVTSQSEVKVFEKNLANICKTKYCVALNSGTDALTLALHSIGVKRGDQVITPSNSFIASTAAIVHLGAVPVFVDVKSDQNIDENEIEKRITKKTKAIMPVHLGGRMCNMDKILNISKKYKISVIEDCAQSIMSMFKKRMAGSIGDIGCFSAHPLKNLNAAGDAGYIVTNSYKHYKKIMNLRNHGIENRNKVRNFGYVSRMDNIQACILNFRIKYLKKVIQIRRRNVKYYLKYLNSKYYFFCKEKKEEYNTYHTFVIQVKKRNALKKYLLKNGIETAIHYPIPIHLQLASKYLGYKKGSLINTEKQAGEILTLPINQFLKEKDIKYICYKINNFYENKK